MNNTVFKAPICKLNDFNNLFIEMTAKNCNFKCKHCYIDFPISKKVKDFIPFDTVKKALIDTKSENLQCIYFIGAEPMTHPDFNNILRLCLKRSNVCIFTNGTFINEKKARFLKRVEDEGENEIIFKLSIDHFDEIKNDEIRNRGAYRITLNALKNLSKYGFNPILCITNYYNEDENLLLSEFKKICSNIGFDANDNNFVINNYYDKNRQIETNPNSNNMYECTNGRVLTSKGVYTCPFLTNDYRGRCGADFSDYAKHNTLETNFCAYCSNSKNNIFSINYKLFQEV